MNKTNLIYIASIRKHITLNVFKKHTYKIGHVYIINKGLIHKCVGYDGCHPIIETLAVLDNINGGNIQIIKNRGDVAHAIPSLDFVNGILSGKYKEINSSKYDEIITSLSNFSNSISNKLSEIYGER